MVSLQVNFFFRRPPIQLDKPGFSDEPLFLLEKLGFSGEKLGLSGEPRFQSEKPGLSDAFVSSSFMEKNLVYLEKN